MDMKVRHVLSSVQPIVLKNVESSAAKCPKQGAADARSFHVHGGNLLRIKLQDGRSVSYWNDK